MLLRSIFTFVIAIGFCFAQGALAVKSLLSLDPKKPSEKTAIELPFSYHPVGADETFQIVYQNGSFLLTPESSEAYAIVGMLQPCIGVIFVNTENNHSLAFHKDWTNSFRSMRDIFTEKMPSANPAKIKVLIYSNFSATGEANLTVKAKRPWSQQHEMDEIQRQIMLELKIPKGNIANILHRGTYPDNVLGQYEYAEIFILVDKAGNFYNTCFFGEDLANLKGQNIEDLLGNSLEFDTLDIAVQIGVAAQALQQMYDAFLIEIEAPVWKAPEFIPDAYNARPFVQFNAVAPRAGEAREESKAEIAPSSSSSSSSSLSSSSPGAVLSPSCAHCGALETAKKPLSRCARCREAQYCGAACQKANWKAHKGKCKAPATLQER